jgi:hypothetical protein
MQFILKLIRDRYYITREVEGMTLFLAGGGPNHHWSTDITDARVFQYKRDALMYALQNTAMRKAAARLGDYTLVLDYSTSLLHISYTTEEETYTYKLPAALLTIMQQFILPEDLLKSKRPLIGRREAPEKEHTE